MFGRSHKEPEPVDPAGPLMREVGAALREARCQRAQEIEDVAEILRIQPAYLAALEQGDLSAVPGRTYALGFLRSYAQYLGFDGDDLIAQIRSSGGSLGGGAALQGRAPLTESRLPKVPILVLSLAALAGAYTGWAYFERDPAPSELVEEVPDALRKEAQGLPEVGPRATPPASVGPGAAHARPPADAGSGPAASPSEADPAAPQPAAAMPRVMVAAAEPATGARRAGPGPHPQTALAGAADREAVAQAQALRIAEVASATESGNDSAPAGDAPRVAMAAAAGSDAAPQGPLVVPALAPAPAPVATPQASHDEDPAALGQDPASTSALATEARPPEVDSPARKPRVYGTESPESRVVLRARDKAWVHISSTANDYLWVQTLRPGDVFIVPPRPDLVLWTGNAGGVEVLVDGALLPPLGPEAVVVRDVSLHPRALLRRLLPLPADLAGVSDLASAAKPPMMPPSSR